MSSATGIRAGRAYVELGVENNALSTGLRAAQQRVQSFGASIAGAGSKLFGLSVAAALPLAGAVQTFAGYEQSMARVRAITGAAPEDFIRLQEEAKRLGEVTVYSASDAARAMSEFALAGLSVNDILTSSGPALELAAAGQMDIAEAAKISLRIMKGMGIQASELRESTDLLAKAFTTSATDLVELGEAFKFIGPDARSAGISLAEITAAIQDLSDAGIKGEMAGTTLRGAIQSLVNPSAEGKKMMEQLGVSVRDEQGNFRKFADIIADLENGLNALPGSADKMQGIGEIFSNRQATGISRLTTTDEFGVKGQDRLRKKAVVLNNSQGTGAQIAAVQIDTLYGAWKLLESIVEGVSITLGTALMPTLRELSAVITNGIGIVNNFLKANAEWVPIIAKVILGTAALGVGLMAVGGTISLFGFSIGVIASAASLLVSAIGAIFTPIGLVVAAVGAAAVAIYNMEGSGEALKVVLGAIAAGAILAVAGVGLLVEAVKAVGSVVISSIRGAAEFMQKAFPFAIASITNAFSDMGRNLSNLWDGITRTFSIAWGGIVDAVSAGRFEDAGKIAWAGMKVVWHQGVIWLSNLWQDFSSYFVETFHKATTALARGLNNIWSGLEKAWFETFSVIMKGWGYAMDFMLKTWNRSAKVIADGLIGLRWSVGGIRPENIPAEMAKNQKAMEESNAQIDRDRESVDKKVERDRQDIEGRRQVVEQGIDQAHNQAAGARHASRLRDMEQAARGLAKAEEELADAVKASADAIAKARYEKTGSWFGDYPERKIPTVKSVNESVAQATGIGAGDTAGTFDADMIRFIAGTGNDSMEKEQLRKQEEQIQILKRMLDEIKKSVAGGIFG